MKKTVCKIAALAFIFTLAMPLFTACTPRAETLKILNWGDYMDESILEEFEEYYAERTGGEKVKAKIAYFDDNDELYTKISQNTFDYDLVSPSDYMLQRLMAEGMLQKLDRTGEEYTHFENLGNLNENFRGQTYEANGTTYEFDDYGVAYMWGTTGIAYNFYQVEFEHVRSWGALFNSAYDNKITMKNNARETYPAVAALNSRDELLGLQQSNPAEHRERLLEIIKAAPSSPDALDAIADVLKTQKVAIILSDEDKEYLVKEQAYLGMLWSGDAVYAFDNEYENSGKDSVMLGYYVPEEGSAYWADYWCMPKQAKNTKAAQIFMDFLCDTRIAKRNMIEIGYTTAVATAAEEYRAELEEDDEFWASDKITGVDLDAIKLPAEAKASSEAFSDWYKQMYLDALFPSDDYLARCVMLPNLSQSEMTAVNEMWYDVEAARGGAGGGDGCASMIGTDGGYGNGISGIALLVGIMLLTAFGAKSIGFKRQAV